MNHSDPEEQVHRPEQASAPLKGFSPRQVAKLIRALDSRLASIEYERRAGEPVLTYTFEVAGKAQPFDIAVTSEALESIVDLYPDAAAHEQQLGQFGLMFHPPANE